MFVLLRPLSQFRSWHRFVCPCKILVHVCCEKNNNNFFFNLLCFLKLLLWNVVLNVTISVTAQNVSSVEKYMHNGCI